MQLKDVNHATMVICWILTRLLAKPDNALVTTVLVRKALNVLPTGKTNALVVLQGIM
jgi:hypothetical protein